MSLPKIPYDIAGCFCSDNRAELQSAKVGERWPRMPDYIVLKRGRIRTGDKKAGEKKFCRYVELMDANPRCILCHQAILQD